MPHVVAVLLSAWAALRWATLPVGIVRARRFSGPARKEARRAVIVRASLTVFLSVAAMYAWAIALDLSPRGSFVGFLGGVLMFSLVAAVLAGFMQPAERTPETMDLFRIRPRREPPEPGPEPPQARPEPPGED